MIEWHPIHLAPFYMKILVDFPELGVRQVERDPDQPDTWLIDDGKYDAIPLRGWLKPPTHWAFTPTRGE